MIVVPRAVAQRDAMAHIAALRGEMSCFASYPLRRNIRAAIFVLTESWPISSQLHRTTPGAAAPAAGELREGGRAEAVVPAITWGAFAWMIGTTQSRVSDFREQVSQVGFIDCNGSLDVLSSRPSVV